MRSDSILYPSLRFFRLGTLICNICVGGALVLTTADWFADQGILPGRDGFHFGTAILLIGLLIVGRIFNVRFRRVILAAERQRRESLARAHADALTGVHTRAYFIEELHTYFSSSAPVPVGYLQLDMDHLKTINDTQGHAAGDAALRHLVQTMRQRMPEAIIGRLGGDEFGIALIGQSNKHHLLKLANRLLHDLGEEVEIGDRKLRLAATVGIAASPVDADQMIELMSRADLALYRGKRQGRAMAVVYDDDMMVDERYARNLLRELRAALLLDEIKVYYQPVYAVDGQTLKSYEALVRWEHPVRGLVPPCDFIPFAEKSDLIDRLSEAVMRQV